MQEGEDDVPYTAAELAPRLVKGYDGEPVRMVTGSWKHTLFLTEDQRAFGFGNNDYGQLGIPFMQKHEVSYPVCLQTLQVVKLVKIATGRCHSVCLSNEGQVFSFGYQEFGQLGNGVISKNIEELPTRIDRLLKHKLTDVACGLDHTLVLTENGDVHAWGFNQEGQCGDDSATDLDIPTPVKGLTKKVTRVFAGLDYSMAVTEDGDFFTWGAGEGLQMANGEKDIKLKPVLSGIPNEKITDMACSGASVVALTESNAVYSWGVGMTGRLGHGDEEDSPFPRRIAFFDNLNKRIVQISGRGGNYLALADDGSLYSWGLGLGGRLGNSDELNQYTPNLVSFFRGRKIICIGTGIDHSIVVVQEE